MKRIAIHLVPILFVIMILPACAPEPEPPAEQVTNIEADMEALKALPEQWDVTYHANDLEAIMQLYTQDAVRLPPNEDIQDGKEAIRNHLQSEFSEYTSEGEIVVIDARVSGDLGYVRGTYIGKSTSKTGGEPIMYDNRFVTVAQRQVDGSWKSICEIWNDSPPSEQ
jgi:uncharacterized protein (TIGR02246 family)